MTVPDFTFQEPVNIVLQLARHAARHLSLNLWDCLVLHIAEVENPDAIG